MMIFNIIKIVCTNKNEFSIDLNNYSKEINNIIHEDGSIKNSFKQFIKNNKKNMENIEKIEWIMYYNIVDNFCLIEDKDIRKKIKGKYYNDLLEVAIENKIKFPKILNDNIRFCDYGNNINLQENFKTYFNDDIFERKYGKNIDHISFDNINNLDIIIDQLNDTNSEDNLYDSNSQLHELFNSTKNS